MVDRQAEQMNPRLILALWRERWGKSDGRSAMTSNRKGYLSVLGDHLMSFPVWSWPGVAVGAVAVCVLLFILIMLAPLTQNSQLVFSFLLIGMALYARRCSGIFVTQLLVGLSLIASARYFYWRFSATLGQSIDLDFVLGFCLCVAELYLCLLIGIGFIQNLWPLKQPSIILPSNSGELPTVDVFITGHSRSNPSIESSVKAALALDWPKNKIKIYILDAGYREDIKKLADLLGVLYKSYSDTTAGIPVAINLALADSKGELVTIFDGDKVPDQHFLRESVGWFLDDLKLGMIQTPKHFLVPSPTKHSLELFDVPYEGGTCVLIRRAMLHAAGGVSTEPVGRYTHTALKLQELGYTNAYIGFSRSVVSAGNKQKISVSRPEPSSPQAFRVDHPFWGEKLRWRQYLDSLMVMLRFYYIVPRLIFITAPLAYLLLETNIIQASVALYAAYALPYLMFVHLTQERMQGEKRFPLWVDIRDTMLAWYMLLPTAVTFVRTKVAGYVSAFKGERIKQEDPFDLLFVVSIAAAVFLNLAGLVVGIARLLSSETIDLEVTFLYLLWTLYNLMILAAVLAVAEESRYILKYRRRQLRMPAMIKLPLGRSIYGMTVNFPEPSLLLALPTPIALEAGSELHVSIFREHREYLFSARVVSVDGRQLQVDIVESAQNDYRAFVLVVFSRGHDWPKWLPGREADQPLPVWVVNAFNFVYIAMLGFTRPLGGWVEIWKNRK